ncbi:OmpA family protein [Vibrio sp. H11]|uniref:OmpA family protein n=1 Tax=Vibrio sp. H11 TaxID=2565928 RepID=UPI0014560D76|nr:OmpA family protein [Vibrio sp. H11]
MKITILSLSVMISLAACPSLAGDEYDYIKTPLANQVADLQDDDWDGVINARDLCPDTPKGALIDNDGCGEVIQDSDKRQLHILFAHDSYEINPVFSDQIQEMAMFLKKYPSASIEIQGYTSKVGTNDYNLDLSKQRADAVERKLLSYGIDAKRVRIIGYGESRLVDDGDSNSAHAVNRRVTATVVGLKEKVVEEWTIFTTKKK